MRRFLSTLMTVLLSSTLAVAQEDADQRSTKDGKGDTEAKPGASMDSGDPVDKETSEPGPYAPKGKTGDLKESAAAKLEGEELAQARARDKFVVFGELLIGFGRAPLNGVRPDNDTQETGDGTSFTLIAGGRYDLSPSLSAGLRIPLTTASLKNVRTRQSEGAFALGNPELLGEYRVELSPRTRLPVLFGVAIPVAMGEPDPSTIDTSAKRQNNVNLVADAASGARDGELFWTKRLPLVLGVGLVHERRALLVHAETKFVAGINTGGAVEDPEYGSAGTFEAPALALRNVTGGGVSYEFLSEPSLFGGIDAWVVYNAIEPIEYTSRDGAETPSPFQLVAEPRAGGRFGKISPSLGLIFPIGGRLADSGITGVRLHVDVAL